ncbi:MAG: NADH-quinone oxidoreductase subunit N [Acidobacteriota bacterium]
MLSSIAGDLGSILSEIFLSIVSFLILILDPFLSKEKKRIVPYIALSGLAISFFILFFQKKGESFFFEALTLDNFSLFFKSIFLISSVIAILFSIRFLNDEKFQLSEYYFFILLCTVGMMFMASSIDLISIFISYELMAISSYVLSGYLKKDLRSNEAGLKYFILGTLSTGIFLFGLSFVFGLSGNTSLKAISTNLVVLGKNPYLIFTMLIVSSALFFKIAAVPFHMWTPDVYEGAPTPVTLFISTGPKAASFAIFLRIFLEAFSSLSSEWRTLIAWVSFFTMTYGNFAALTQKSLKRMLAYSSIAHAGYILIGFAAGGDFGEPGILFYLLAYLFMNSAAFGLILFLKKGDKWGEDVDDFNGLAKNSLLFSFAIVIILMSLVGIPPTGGFFGKYFIFSSAIKEGLVWLAVAGVLNSAISLFYYFRIGQAVFMKEPSEEVKFSPSPSLSIALGIAVLAILILGIFPQPFAVLSKSSTLLP